MSKEISYLTAAELERDLCVRDLSDPSEGSHAIQLVVDRCVDTLARAWGGDVRWCRGPRIVPIADNYDRLGFGTDTITRDARYTRYASDQHMLRSHSSAMVPPAIRRLADDPADDVLLVCPGIVFRRDAIDRQHTGTPHQLDLWRITRWEVGDADMDEMIALLLDALTPELAHRQEARVHPYTRNGRQVDLLQDGRWVELGEGGVVHPDVLVAAGLIGRSGLALGMGLDRMLMLIKAIPDIRLLRSGDPRISNQMLDLAAYRRVSSMPPITRDLSVAVANDDDEETLGDRVRDALDDDAGCVEEVRVLSTTPYERLPPSAVGRLGAKPEHKNVLLRIVLRDLEQTLTDRAANVLRDRIYGALHQGTTHQWADRTAPRGLTGRRTT